MYPRIVRQMAFMGRGALDVVVLSSALCKSSDRSFSWQCGRSFAFGSWPLAVALCLKPRAKSQELKALRRNSFRPNVIPQHFGNHHAPVRLLIVLHNRNPGAAHGQCAAVQRVYEFGLVLAFRAITNVGAPRLIRFE